MNTDIRRKIFFATMSADDYLDAYKNIQDLNLKVILVNLPGCVNMLNLKRITYK